MLGAFEAVKKIGNCQAQRGFIRHPSTDEEESLVADAKWQCYACLSSRADFKCQGLCLSLYSSKKAPETPSSQLSSRTGGLASKPPNSRYFNPAPLPHPGALRAASLRPRSRPRSQPHPRSRPVFFLPGTCARPRRPWRPRASSARGPRPPPHRSSPPLPRPPRRHLRRRHHCHSGIPRWTGPCPRRRLHLHRPLPRPRLRCRGHARPFYAGALLSPRPVAHTQRQSE